MRDSIIIDVRDNLPLTERIQNEASTAMLWGTWIWLCRPLMILHKFVSFLSLEGIALLGGTCGALVLWDRLSPKSRLESYCTPAVCNLDEVRDVKICTIHHDDNGNIVRVEAKV